MAVTLVPATGENKAAYIMAASGETVTYGELEACSNQAAHFFRQSGLQAGDHIALLMENNSDFFKICWAAHRAGLYYTAISTRLLAKEVTYIVNNCGAKLLITSDVLAPLAEEIKEGVAGQCSLYMRGAVIDGYLSWEQAISTLAVTPLDDQTEGVDMLYSSGTTGMPKGVKRLLPDIAFGEPNPLQSLITRQYNMTENTVYLSPAPCYHAASLRFNLFVMRAGGTCIIMEKFDAGQLMMLIEKYRVTLSQLVPTMFVRLLKLPEELRSACDFSSLEKVVHAAAPCPLEIKQQMIDWWGPIIHEYYGGTEGTGLTGLDSHEWLAHQGSVGKSILGKVRIVGDDNEELPPGETGLVYFDSSLTFEYYRDPEKTREAIHPKGWSTLGDIGYLDKDDYLYLTDRKAFTIISGGVNIYPQEIENLLITHPEVMDVAVIGVPNEEFGEEVKAIVQPVSMHDANDQLAADLLQFCRENLSPIKCPRTLDFDPELPRQPTGKLFKRLLKDKFWS